jgi:zinc/manganese transport system substrate-binding protein
MSTHRDRNQSNRRIESPTSRRRRVARRLRATFTVLPLFVAASACASTDSAGTPPAETVSSAAAPLDTTVDAPLPTVAVTYSVLASVVRELVDGVAEVVTIIPDGVDPHEFEPSAKDLETINNAQFVVANGLQFEEGLETALEQLHQDGGPVFFVGEHITVRKMSEGHDHGHGLDTEKEEGHDHSHGAGDPHLWLSPGAMLEMLPELSSELATALNANLDAALADVTAELTSLDTEIAALFANVDTCELVTGHDELGYFADRYGCEMIGAIIPSSTTTSEASAGELAKLKAVIAEHGATVVFTSLGTPTDVAKQVAKETGATLVELSTHVMGDAGSYADFVRNFAKQIAEALA